MNYLFIGGCGRSGTSLLQDLLVQHSLIAGSSEFNFCKRILELKSSMQNAFYLGRNNEFYDQKFLNESYNQFIAGFLNNVSQNKPKATWISEKTPDNIEVLNELFEVFPLAKFIYVYRDGRDVAASYLNVNKRLKSQGHPYQMNVVTLSKKWNAARAFRQLAKPEYANNIFDIRYEDLIREPAKTLESLFKFLEIPVEDVINQRMKHDAKDTIIRDGYWFTEDLKRKSIDQSSLEKWRTELSFLQRIIANTIMAKGLRMHEYPVEQRFIFWGRLLRKIA